MNTNIICGKCNESSVFCMIYTSSSENKYIICAKCILPISRDLTYKNLRVSNNTIIQMLKWYKNLLTTIRTAYKSGTRYKCSIGNCSSCNSKLFKSVCCENNDLKEILSSLCKSCCNKQIFCPSK